MRPTRREWLKQSVLGSIAVGLAGESTIAGTEPPQSASNVAPLRITGLKITPIALPDPPILAASGCHGPYFLRNIVELQTDAGITGIGETPGGERELANLQRARDVTIGQNAFAYRAFAKQVFKMSPAAYAAIEMACLDACGKATGRRLCELLGGPVREKVEFAAYLFFRYAADHPTVLSDARIVDERGRGDKALDQWGEVRTPEAMAEMANRFHEKWGFRVFKLKAGVLPPDVELASLQAMNDRFGGRFPLRIDPNGCWTVDTAIRMGKAMKGLPVDYYEDPVDGQESMAVVRRETGWKMSTNSCVTRFEHIPKAIKLQPVDVVLGDHHYWGGITGVQELGRICETLGWGLSQHSNSHAGVTMAAMAHVGAVAPQLTLASDTHYVWLVDGADVIAERQIAIRDGKVAVPKGPGLGVSLDHDRLGRANETYRKSGMRERDDATMMRNMVPGWKRTLF